jgi:AcrR family transcriptional regulator
MRRMLEAYNSREGWPDRLRAAVACGVVEGLLDDPARAAFAAEVLATGDAARARRDMTMRVVASLIDAGRNEMEDPESVPHTTAEALAGAAYGQVYSRVARGCPEQLPELVSQLLSAHSDALFGYECDPS